MSIRDGTMIGGFAEELTTQTWGGGDPFYDLSPRARGILSAIVDYVIWADDGHADIGNMIPELAAAIAHGDVCAREERARVTLIQRQEAARLNLWLSRTCPYCGAAPGKECRTHRGTPVWYGKIHSGRKRKPSDYREPGAVWRDAP